MDGVASRLSRASSRYSGPSATAVFDGRVRKWKKKWVRVTTSPVGIFRASKPNGWSHSSPQHHMLLHKWTPLPSTKTVTASGETEEPPKRRFRYAPIAMLGNREKVATMDCEVDDLEEESDEFDAESPLRLRKGVELDMNMTDTDQTKKARARHWKLGLCLNSQGAEE